jgi:starch-binding outer membrane protein, SusD/RagB family
MKKLRYILFISILFIGLTSCDDFLTESAQPLDQLGGQSVFNTESKIRAGVSGIYAELYTYRDAAVFFKYFENISDNASEDNNDRDIISSFTQTRNAPTGEVWSSSYRIISRVNVLLEDVTKNLPDYASNPKINRHIGEARFLRAFAYFNLVTIFGDVPLITKQVYSRDEAVSFTRSPLADVFSQAIIPDLEYAAKACLKRSELTTLGQLGNITNDAAKVLLAEAYLNTGKYTEAEKVSEEVIDGKEYSLMATYASLYGAAADNNRESIWEIQFNFALNGISNNWIRLLPFELRTGSAFTLPQAISTPTVDLVDAMKDDPRLSTTFLTSLPLVTDPNRTVSGRMWRKYHDFTIVGSIVQNDWNIKMLRLADAYHLAAEAEIRLNKNDEAFAHLNVLRKRAGVKDYTTASITPTMDAMDLYLHERRMEFAGEMKRFRDLKRTGRATRYLSAYRTKTERVNVTIAENKLVYPIPESEILANPAITQNPGY